MWQNWGKLQVKLELSIQNWGKLQVKLEFCQVSIDSYLDKSILKAFFDDPLTKSPGLRTPRSPSTGLISLYPALLSISAFPCHSSLLSLLHLVVCFPW